MNAPNAKAPGVASSEGLQEHHLPTGAIVAPSDESGNQRLIANIISAFELRGFSVHRLEHEAFLVCRWGMSRPIPDLRTLIAFGKQVGATA